MNSEKVKSQSSTFQSDSDIVGKNRGKSHWCFENVKIQLIVDPQIQDVIDIHVVDILETYGLLLRREWTKCLR